MRGAARYRAPTPRHLGDGRRYRRRMRRMMGPAVGLVCLVACGEDGPTRALFGLDQRPSNTTCLARPRPVIDTGVTLQRKWSGLSFNQPIYVAQAPGEDTQWYVVERGG